MSLKLYHVDSSPPAFAVRMAAKLLNVPLTLENIDFFNKAHLQPEFLKINPTHTVPTLDDNGFIIFDSHAILMYLADKYSKNDDLYPKDVKKRAIINQILCLDNGTLFSRLRELIRPILFNNETNIPEDKRQGIIEAYSFLETFLEQRKWIAGDTVTIADPSVLATISTLDVVIPLDAKTHPKLVEWFKNCQKLAWYSENVAGMAAIKELINGKIKK